MEKLVNQISEIGIVPVVVINNADDALPLAKALCSGGINCAEVTFRTACAEESIKRISAEFPDMLIGAGTVLSPETADKAINAGAKFIVSPGLNPTVVEHCKKMGYPIIPGVCTPTEVELALSLGLTYLKFFPAEAAGGVNMIKSLCAPYTNIKFMPTGGISAKNASDYLSIKSVFAIGGSWMVKGDLIADGKFDDIAALTKEASDLVKNIRG